MPKYPDGHTDAGYFLKTKAGSKRKYKRVAGSTTATCRFLTMVNKNNPEMTILQLKELLLDKTKFIYNPEAIAVLDAHIKAGAGDQVPNWK